MTDLLLRLGSYFSYPFVRYALIAGLLVSLCASLFGTTLVLKRFSFIGDGLSHVAFGSMAIASALGVKYNMAVVLPITVLAAVLLLRTGQKARLKGDASLAILSVSALALGYLCINLFSPSSNLSGDVCGTLFGASSILTVSRTEVLLCLLLALLVLGFYLFFYHRIFSVTFDEEFAQGSGLRVDAYNLIIAVVTAVIIVIAMRLVGSLLITALVIFPAVSAMRLLKSYRHVAVFSAVFSLLTAGLGMLLSILFSTPVGATMVATQLAGYLICQLLAKLQNR